MAKRRDVVSKELKKYDVENGIEKVLGDLKYERNLEDLVPNWNIYTRGDTDQEFSAIYSDSKSKYENKFLVTGNIKKYGLRFNELYRDLYHMNSVLNDGILVRVAKHEPLGGALLLTSLIAGFCLYDFLGNSCGFLKGVQNYLQTSSLGINKYDANDLLLVSGIGSLPLSLGSSMGFSNLTNLVSATKLSKNARNYRYGKEAEKKLLLELQYNDIREGDLTLDQFFSYHGLTDDFEQLN